MVYPQEIVSIIEKILPDAKIEVLDPMNDGQHLQARVASEKFRTMRLLEQHKLIMTGLREVLKERLHALQLKTCTPEEW